MPTLRYIRIQYQLVGQYKYIKRSLFPENNHMFSWGDYNHYRYAQSAQHVECCIQCSGDHDLLQLLLVLLVCILLDRRKYKHNMLVHVYAVVNSGKSHYLDTSYHDISALRGSLLESWTYGTIKHAAMQKTRLATSPINYFLINTSTWRLYKAPMLIMPHAYCAMQVFFSHNYNQSWMQIPWITCRDYLLWLLWVRMRFLGFLHALFTCKLVIIIFS